jgi:AraC-like DNA-binding protein
MPPTGHVADPDAIVRIAERDAGEASVAVGRAIVAKSQPPCDWPDLLANHLRGQYPSSLSDWADRVGLAPETLSRGFGKLYGVSPARYRLEYRARFAWEKIVRTTRALADIALECGFADQSHMSRAVRAVTGESPLAWRVGKSNPFKTVRASSP